MKIATFRFGELEIPEENVIEFPKGLIGFEQFKQFVLLERRDSEPFRWLQSLEDPDLAFVVVNPVIFFKYYKIEVHYKELEDIQVSTLDRTQIFTVITIPDDISRMSANLLGPLVINLDNNCGKQIVLSNSTYTTRHYLLDELNKGARELAGKHSLAVQI
ncbi:MAG TPA: flagellar assembly protein FliW [candidate division Zixibacteria bacterium]|nr:flagellar assembly protein FliW [candidate division Zixibacteria bacterium]HEQ98688.1 flagellar assembly protein FliW [candidate division Zixibacteria bacterium]